MINTNEIRITEEYLNEHPNEVFVFGDNYDRRGVGGAAALRHCKNTYGFITKKRPTHFAEDHFTSNEYRAVYYSELEKLKKTIICNPDKTYLISRLGGGLANVYHIFEEVIEPTIKKELKSFSNVRFLF